jgi:hypothetical protein
MALTDYSKAITLEHVLGRVKHQDPRLPIVHHESKRPATLSRCWSYSGDSVWLRISADAKAGRIDGEPCVGSQLGIPFARQVAQPDRARGPIAGRLGRISHIDVGGTATKLPHASCNFATTI